MNNLTRKLAHSPIENSRCAAVPFGCGKPVNYPQDFTDALSAKEYMISGLCQACQDRIFVDPDDDSDERNSEIQTTEDS